MSPQFHTVLLISLVGTVVLFSSIGALVGLMYLLTSPWMFPFDERPPRRVRRRKRRRQFRRRASDIEPLAGPPDAPADDGEHERRRRAVALAAAVACAEVSQLAMTQDGSPEWRLAHRARRLELPASRRKAGR